jgi:hypothetical protein
VDREPAADHRVRGQQILSTTPRHHVPTILQPLHTEEFQPVPLSRKDHVGIQHVAERGEQVSVRLSVAQHAWTSSRLGTAAGLLALNKANGDTFYELDADADIDCDAADASFHSDSFVMDVQSHFLADREDTAPYASFIGDIAQPLAPRWGHFTSLINYQMDEYFRCLFIESETDIAVLTSAPGVGGAWLLTNDEMAATRELTSTLGGQGRLLNHTVVRPTFDEDLEQMAYWSSTYGTAGWKVYTLGSLADLKGGGWGDSYWELDSPDVGIPFLERVRETGTKIVCAHKGLTGLAPGGSPRDVGPAARLFPDIDFLVYHSGYDVPNEPGAYLEGPYSEEVAHLGINRLLTSCMANGIGKGGNTYAEIGATWFMLIKRPVEAAHALGKLLNVFGEENIVWGTDSIWWGPTQPLIDAFRAFQIPLAMREEFGYPEITKDMKDKILGLNGARVYKIDMDRARHLHADDDVSWARAMMRERQPPALGIPAASAKNP